VSAVRRLPASVVGVLLALLVAAAYGNTLSNGFHLDDVYGIVENPALRELASVPSYFTDPYTLTTRSLNADWRPLLQVTYALDYWASGLEPWSWRLTQLALHWMACVGLWAFARALLGCGRVRDVASLSEREGEWIALAAAALYCVHPITSGAANYAWARSSLLVTVFALPASTLWLRSLAAPANRAAWLGALACFALALLVKAEALSIALVFGAADLLLLRRVSWRRLWPVALLCCAYLTLRFTLLPEALRRYHEAGPADRGEYLLTQFRAWWYYVGQVCAPLELVADYGDYPISRTLLDTRVGIALAGWLAVAALLAAAVRRAPAAALLGGAFFLHLAPHSSVIPLSEMVNEHRPYLPVTGLFVLAVWGGWLALRRACPAPRATAALLFVLALGAYGARTRERNRDWRDELTLWRQTAAQCPNSARAQMNYGLELQRSGESVRAETYLARAVELAPLYPYAHINYALALRRRGEIARSNLHYDEAVRVAPDDPIGPLWRARVREESGDLVGARADWQRTLELDPRNAEARAKLASGP
jgi:tetratricopeptide (TPR) repeat protein